MQQLPRSSGGRRPETPKQAAVPPQRSRVKRANVDDGSWQLIKQTQAGDAEAFGLFYDRYFDAVYQYIARVVPDQTSIEDLTGDTFFHALRLVPTVRTDLVSPRRWLLNLARHAIRVHHLTAAPPTTSPDNRRHPQVPNPPPLPAHAVIHAPDADLVRRILARRF